MTAALKEVLEERGRRYGVFTNHARATQRMKVALKGGSAWEFMGDDQKEAAEMIVHKLGRIVCGDPHYADSWVDIAGYATLVANRLTEGEQDAKQTSAAPQGV